MSWSEGTCLYVEANNSITVQMVIRNETGGSMSVGGAGDLRVGQYGQEQPDGHAALLTRLRLDASELLTWGDHVPVVRRIDRKLATFDIVHTVVRDHCEFDIAMVIEP